MAQKTEQNEQVGFHKGALTTLANERNELARILQIVEQLMQAHIKALKDLGVDLEAETFDKWRPIHYICFYQHDIKIIIYIIDKGVNLEAKDKHGNGQLDYINHNPYLSVKNKAIIKDLILSKTK